MLNLISEKVIFVRQMEYKPLGLSKEISYFLLRIPMVKLKLYTPGLTFKKGK